MREFGCELGVPLLFQEKEFSPLCTLLGVHLCALLGSSGPGLLQRAWSLRKVFCYFTPSCARTLLQSVPYLTSALGKLKNIFFAL